MWKYVGSGIKILLLVVLLAQGAALLAEKIDLTTADLGRHITNGDILLHGSLADKRGVLSTNFYSFTQPEFPFINHHWGSGLIFYWLTQAGGFELDSIFYIVMGVLTLLVMFDVTRKIANFWVALGLSSLLLPLMMSRAEVRPETMTYFFSSVFFWILWHWQTGRINKRWLYALPVIILVWVNIHIAWFFGPLLIVLFLLGEAWQSRKIYNLVIKQYLIILVLCGAASLVNPNGIWGALYPLTIFRQYGYLIVENQTIPFLERLNHTTGLHFVLIKSLMAIMAAGLLAVITKLRKQISLELLLVGILVAIMAWFGLRNFPFFGFFALPVLAYCIEQLWPSPKHLVARVTLATRSAVMVPLAIFAILVSIFQTNQLVEARGDVFGIGLLPGANGSADFFTANNMQGPIFNDYDIGGYLIYNLYPSQKVFVDNRPEAYSVDFFQKTYIPAQEDSVKWQALDDQYHFNSIFFSYRDLTPWAQTFLISRINDPAWAPVFVDSYNIIFLKRNTQNQDLIKKYELPKSMFRVN